MGDYSLFRVIRNFLTVSSVVLAVYNRNWDWLIFVLTGRIDRGIIML